MQLASLRNTTININIINMEEKPILPPGLHDFELNQLENHFLSDFPDSTTRAVLIEGLKKYINVLKSLEISIEVWLDGSFTTTKTNPNDIDLVIFASEKAVNKLDSKKQEIFRRLTNRRKNKQKFGCDVLFSVKENQEMRSYWRGWYGFDRNESPKGIARIMVNI